MHNLESLPTRSRFPTDVRLPRESPPPQARLLQDHPPTTSENGAALTSSNTLSSMWPSRDMAQTMLLSS